MIAHVWPTFVVVVASVITHTFSVQADDKPTVTPDHARRMREGLALFKEKVRPALVENCLKCHGGKVIKAGLDLSDRAALIESGVIEGGGNESRLSASFATRKNRTCRKRPRSSPMKPLSQLRLDRLRCAL